MYDMLILGAGIGGRSLCWEALRLGLFPCLIEKAGVTGYSSVRNQGWLHSGAHYANEDAVKNSAMLPLCFKASRLIREFDIEYNLNAVGKEKTLFVYTDKDKRNSDYNLIYQFQKILSIDKNSVLTHPLIDQSESAYSGGFIAEDTTVDALLVMQHLSKLILENGGDQISVDIEDWNEILIDDCAGFWRLKIGDIHLDAKLVIVSLGVKIKDFVLNKKNRLQKYYINTEVQRDIQNATISRSRVFAIKNINSYPPLITYDDHMAGVSYIPNKYGATICIHTPTNQNYDQDNLSDQYLQSSDREWEQLVDALPKLKQIPKENIPIYECEKLNIGYKRQPFFGEVFPDFFAFYPGKFTTSFYGAANALKQAQKRLGFRSFIQSKSIGLSNSFRFRHPLDKP